MQKPLRQTPISRTEQKQRAAADTRPRTTLSWYRYVQLADPEAFRNRLLQQFSVWDCFGRIYVASEGINAQMNVPTEYWEAFDTWVQAQPELAGVPYKIAVEEANQPSFYKLTIKIRSKIVADGLDDSSFDVTNTGEYLTAEEMNEYIDDPEAVVVDMRNAYESEVGHFTNAITPAVETFREELETVPETLRVHKNKKIALYCTGGIRCEKASAWLKHQGFTNVRHLQGGIIEYAHQVKEKQLPNKFRGKNFVFDERMGERVSDEVVAQCHLCHATPADTHYHCKNQMCHTLYIGCEHCVEKQQGYCSRVCALGDRLPESIKKPMAHYYAEWQRRKPFRKTPLRSN
jgi:UPF0176 protein